MSSLARRQRRAARRLTGSKQKLEQLTTVEERLAKSRQAILEAKGTLEGIVEQYVSEMAAQVDPDSDVPLSPEVEFEGKQIDKEVAAHLAKAGWQGCKTEDEAAQKLSLAIVERTLSKGDLALLLSALDTLAFKLARTIPESLKQLRGEELVDGIVKVLVGENEGSAFKFLSLDSNWPAMKERWVKLGWKGTVENTFDDVFLRSAAERVIEIQARNARDTVIDIELKKLPKSEQEKNFQLFRKRLEHEYQAIVEARKLRYPAVPKMRSGGILSTDDKAALGAFAESIGYAEQSVARGAALLKTMPLPLPMPWIRSMLEAEKAGRLDDLLAGWGQSLWEACREAEDYDAALRAQVAYIMQEKATPGLPPESLMFAGVWAVDAFQRITTTHTFAAALMCSDPDRGALEELQKQWRAVLFMIPNGLLTIPIGGAAVRSYEGVPLQVLEKDPFELTRILISVDDASAKMVLFYPLQYNGKHFYPYQVMRGATLAELLTTEPVGGKDPREDRVLKLAQRLVAGTLLAMQSPENFTSRKVNNKPGKIKRIPGPPEHRHIHVGRPLTIDLRPQIADYLAGKKDSRGRSRKGGPPTVQVLVRGHWRRQVCGVGRLERKVIWIEPFWRGPEEAIISVRPKDVRRP